MCTWDAGYVLLLLVETSCSSELNSFDNSSAVAKDALKSSFIDWTECNKTTRNIMKCLSQLVSISEKRNRSAKRWNEATHTACCCHNSSGSSWLRRSSYQLLKEKPTKNRETRVRITVAFRQFMWKQWALVAAASEQSRMIRLTHSLASQNQTCFQTAPRA